MLLERSITTQHVNAFSVANESIFFSLLSDSEECCGAAGVFHHVQCRAAQTFLSPVHCAQHGGPAGVKVRIFFFNMCCSALVTTSKDMKIQIYCIHWDKYSLRQEKVKCLCLFAPLFLCPSELWIFLVMKFSLSFLQLTGGWWVTSHP